MRSTTRARYAAAALPVMLVFAACSDSDNGGYPSPVTATRPARPDFALELATSFAPLIHLAGGDKHGPIDASRFIDNATLRWAHDQGCPDDEIDADPTGHVLGIEFHRHQATDGMCRHEGPFYQTTQPTRPHGTDELGGEGFYLDTEDALHDQGSNGAPVYVQYVEGQGDNAGKKGYVYWLFYPWNQAVIKGGHHEGDWERVSVVTDLENKPIRMVFSQHETKCFVDWKDVVGPDGRPVAYSAKGSHGSYPRPGDYDIPDVPVDDQTSAGDRWQTWVDARDVHAQDWWGYGGGWGEVGGPGRAPKVDLGEIQSGPAGPRPGRDMSEVFTNEPCPAPRAEEPKQPRTTEGAIQRFERFLHALGEEDIDTVCDIAGPAAKKAQEQGFGPCESTYGTVFKMISPEQKAVLRNATVDQSLVTVRSPGEVYVPVKAVRPADTFTESDLGSYTLEYLDDKWFITS